MAVVTLGAALAALVSLDPSGDGEWWNWGFLLPSLSALYLVYFAAAWAAVRERERPRSVLAVGAIVTGAACGLWLAGGMPADGAAEATLIALSSVAVITATLLLGSEALYRVGGWRTNPGTA